MKTLLMKKVLQLNFLEKFLLTVDIKIIEYILQIICEEKKDVKPLSKKKGVNLYQ